MENKELKTGKYFSKHLFTDVHAYKCVADYTPKKVGVVRLKVTLQKEAAEKMNKSFIPGGFVGHTDNSLQKWDYEVPEYTDEDIVVLRLHKDGRWYAAGEHCPFIMRDTPYEYYDYNF